MNSSRWQIPSPVTLPDQYLAIAKRYCPDSSGQYVAQILWQREIRDEQQLLSFLDANYYRPTPASAFGQEMKWAVQRLQQARDNQEKVMIWGDFDADGITATSVLWEGLGQFFEPNSTLNYTIPNRLIDSHGLNRAGLERLRSQNTRLIVTCDTGSTNLDEIAYATELGIDIIITDHHTLPDDRPPVIALINPRYFAESHPLYHLSGVAVAYKLVEAMYQSLPEIPTQPLESLLDLVAIGLIADLVQLQGDCRYLAQKGIQVLQTQLSNPTRPGVAQLLKLCQRSGDRPTDISFGIGPRINAISRIQGEASYGVELLTSRDRDRTQTLALETELANSRRKAMQRDLLRSVQQKLAFLDLSTTSVIVLADEQWPSGILGLVASQVAQEYGRPTILLSTATLETDPPNVPPLARGSARSLPGIDLYQLVKSQGNLLHRFGGHPLAAGLSLPVANLALFRDGINQQYKQIYGAIAPGTAPQSADLLVTVSALGKNLFRELKCLEPCGMGNPAPKLWLHNVTLRNVQQKNITDCKGQKLTYIRTAFELWDDSVSQGFPGVWWGHYQNELVQNQPLDLCVELDVNTRSDRYEVRLLDWQFSTSSPWSSVAIDTKDFLVDFRQQTMTKDSLSLISDFQDLFWLERCPQVVDDLYRAYQQARQSQRKLALSYGSQKITSPQAWWSQLVGQVKYLTRTQTAIAKRSWREQWGLSEVTAQLAFSALGDLGFRVREQAEILTFEQQGNPSSAIEQSYHLLISTLQEEQFQRQFFCEVPLVTLQKILSQDTGQNPDPSAIATSANLS